MNGICASCRKSVKLLDRPRPTLHTHICRDDDGKPVASRGIEIEYLKTLEKRYTLEPVT